MQPPAIDGRRRDRFAHASPDAEIFCEPSAEAMRLLRWLGPLSTPSDGRGAPSWRALRHFLVAPFTQLTLVSFDLQMFLFDVLHTSWAARAGHLIGVPGVTLFALALAVRSTGSPLAGVALAALLLVWYAAVARSTRLALWWAITAAVVAALLAAAWLLSASLTPSQLGLGLGVSGAVSSLSHAFEAHFPPRAGDPHRWITIPEYLFGPDGARHRVATVAQRAGRMALYALIGWVNEVWAAPRLVPYVVLRPMMSAGYAPGLRGVLDERVRRAWASGNPALDYVGIGGGTFLAPPAQPSAPAAAALPGP